MALFPAYESTSTSSEAPEENKPEEWLNNSSFQINIPLVPETNQSNDTKSDKRNKEKKSKHKKRKREKTEPVEIIEVPEQTDFVIDVTCNKEFLNVNKIHRPSAPHYHVSYYLTNSTKRKRRKFKRYFKKHYGPDLDKHEPEDDPVITKKSLNETQHKENNVQILKEEESIMQTTASYNKSLNEDPKDINMWMTYIKFQDTLYQFEKVHRKGSMAKAQRVLAERKLAIIDKALSQNPNNEVLLRERLNVAVTTYPADELQTQLKVLVEKNQENIIFWQGYIEATQCSMSHCNTPAVLKLYTKCLSVLHKLRRNSTIDKPVLEESILRILYQCGLFLKQAGLFEQLWTLLRLYLELNLSPINKNKFNIASTFNDQQLMELEEVVFTSELPLHELWLRTEKLRESCHWLPFSEDGQCEDPQRFVFTEDVNELIHPITMPDNVFKMTATILTLMKIPLLPCRHSTMQDLGLDYVPWALDSIESLLPIYLPLFIYDELSLSFLNHNQLAVGPQYLKVLPGQEEYLEFTLETMKNCADCFNGDDKIALNIWWFRFQRILLILGNQNVIKISLNLKKKLKNNVKNFLKNSENRNNQIYYCEYALTEFITMEGKDKVLGIIQTAMDFDKNKELNLDNPPIINCNLVRNFVEVLLTGSNGNDKQKAIQVLCSFVLGKTSTGDENDVKEAISRFKLGVIRLLNKHYERKCLVQHFLPNFLLDFLICQGWLIYLTSGPFEAGIHLENMITKLTEKDNDIFTLEIEILFEFFVAMLFKHSLENSGSGVFKVLDEVLHRAIEKYPNNLFFMRILAKEQHIIKSMGCQWWKTENLLLKTGRSLPVLIVILISLQQFNQLQENVVDTLTGENCDFSQNFKNRMLSLFRKVTKSTMCSRRCGLVWRLYLQFVHAYFDPKLCRNVYYTAVEECPWLKALYIDAAIYIPAELPQIQDLIIEKQLRLHVTPEELDVLRN